MFGRSLATTVGSIGGWVVLLGGVVTFFLGWVHSPTSTLAGPWIPFLGTAILALVILFTSRPRLVWWQGRRLFNGIILVVAGALVWALFGNSVITAVGAAVTVFAGVLLPTEGWVFRAIGLRRRLFHRRILLAGPRARGARRRQRLVDSQTPPPLDPGVCFALPESIPSYWKTKCRTAL